MTNRFKDKVVLIIGAGRGIGRETAIEFAREQARVILCARTENEINIVAAEIVGEHGRADSIVADIADADSVTNLFKTIEQRYGRLDIACNNAGMVNASMPFEDLPIEEFDRIMAVNARGTFLCMREEIRIMKRQGSGVIVNTASSSSHFGYPGLCAYAASKHAVLGLTKTAAMELGRAGVRVVAISPGAVETPMLAEYFERNKDEKEALLAQIPLGRLVQPREVARGIMFLASDDGAQLIGNTLFLDGGLRH